MNQRILIFNWWDIKNPKAGGAEVHLDELFSRLVQKGYSVALVCSEFPGGKREEVVNKIVVRRIAPWWLINVASVFWYFIHRKDFDLIVDYTNKIPYLTPLYIRDKPLIAFALHVFGDIWAAEWGIIGRFFAQIEKILYRCYRRTKIVAISQSTKKDLLKIGIEKNNIEIIYPGIGCPPKMKIERSKNPTVVYLGRLKKYKKIDLIVKSWPAVLSKYPHAKLLIIGTGSDASRLRKLANDHNIIFLGRVSEKEKYYYFQRAWLLVQPSIKEGWGLTVMEAAMVGTPSLVANSPGLSEIVKHNQTGWIFPAGDSGKLARSITNIFENHQSRKKISQNARAKSAKFSWDESASDLEKIIRESM
jgi:glycosyltransferase involved in cell wall biosynthesis